MQDSTSSLSSSLYQMVDTPSVSSALDIPPCADENNLHANYILRTQSSRLHDDNSVVGVPELNTLLRCDVQDRIMEVGSGIAGDLFPDETFGFAINDQFVKNFCGSIISTGKLFDTSNFRTEKMTSTFLNQMVTTIAGFLSSTKKTTLIPLRYFSSVQSSTPVSGHPAKVKPDIMIVPLIDGCTRKGSLGWTDAHAFIEHTLEKKPPLRMSETTRVKTYMAFCNQPERDFIPFVCITKNGFHIVVTDHSGQIETDMIHFSRTGSTLVFFRMVMGLAFLPGSNLGLDPTIIRRDQGTSSGQKMSELYPPYNYNIPNPNIKVFVPDSPSIAPSTTYIPDFDDEGDNGIIGIRINDQTYRVIRLLFRTQTLVGRATKTFLVKLPDGSLGVIKDSWISSGRANEASFLEALDIPFGPQLIDHCVLRNTTTFRDNPIKMCLKPGYREKRCICTYPAGVHISNSSSLWELMVALLDTVIAILYLESCRKLHCDISYTNILLREPVNLPSAWESANKLKIRQGLIESLGLSDIARLRQELQCREGLLIDFDYGASLSSLEDLKIGEGKTTHLEQGLNEEDENTEGDGTVPEDPPLSFHPSGSRTGTPPFIALELLIHGSSHRVVHDLESIFYVLLFICTHLNGPFGERRDPPLYGHNNKNHPSSMRRWLAGDSNLSDLGHLKLSHMQTHFETHILAHISPYFNPLKKYIREFWNILMPRELKRFDGLQAVQSPAIPQDIVKIFTAALRDDQLIKDAKGALLQHAKRSLPGELVIDTNCWDAVKSPKTPKKPKLTPSTTRHAILLTKGTKRSKG